MGILLVRHSDAVEGGGDVDDAARWLSAAGRVRALTAAHELTKKGLRFDRFVTSPRVRAVQTAELYARVLGFDAVVESLPALCFSEPAQNAVAALRALRGNIAAFGHMPSLADVVRMLGHEKQAKGLATSEAVWIEEGKVLWRLASA